MAVTERLIESARPMVAALNTPEDIRRAGRVDEGIGQDGKPRLDIWFGASWNSNSPLLLGPFHLWIDSSGRLRVKQGKATSDTDGSIVGAGV